MKNRHTDNSFLNVKNNITDNNDIEIISYQDIDQDKLTNQLEINNFPNYTNKEDFKFINKNENEFINCLHLLTNSKIKTLIDNSSFKFYYPTGISNGSIRLGTKKRCTDNMICYRETYNNSTYLAATSPNNLVAISFRSIGGPIPTSKTPHEISECDYADMNNVNLLISLIQAEISLSNKQEKYCPSESAKAKENYLQNFSDDITLTINSLNLPKFRINSSESIDEKINALMYSMNRTNFALTLSNLELIGIYKNIAWFKGEQIRSKYTDNNNGSSAYTKIYLISLDQILTIE